MKPFLAVLAVILALPMSAFARTDGPRQDPRITSGSPDVVHSAPAVHALGTDVAAPDQQASKLPTNVPVAVPRDDGFDWAAASIGAAGAIGLLVAMLGATAVLRRRRHPSVAAF